MIQYYYCWDEPGEMPGSFFLAGAPYHVASTRTGPYVAHVF